MAGRSPFGKKTLLQKEKLFVTSNFSCSHNVFKRVLLHTCKNQSLFGKGLNCLFLSKPRRGYELFNNKKLLHLSEFKACADNNLFVAKFAKFVRDRVESIVVKEENAGYKHVLLFPLCFQKLSFFGSLKVYFVVKS